MVRAQDGQTMEENRVRQKEIEHINLYFFWMVRVLEDMVGLKNRLVGWRRWE